MNYCKCGEPVHPVRQKYGYKTCVKCSSTKRVASAPITNHKTGNTIQIVSQEVSIELIKISEFSSLRRDPEGIDRMALELRNHLLNQELNDGINIRSFINENLTK